MRSRVARVVLGASVMRVFAPDTKAGLMTTLENLPVDELPQVVKDDFRRWYETQLKKVAAEIRKRNAENSRVQPGLKWGHAAKVLSLYLRDLVEHSRYFTDREAKAIAPLLHVPIDGIVIDRLRALSVTTPCRKIKEIDSAAKFYEFQELLEDAAKRVGVPRIWFDDNWGAR